MAELTTSVQALGISLDRMRERHAGLDGDGNKLKHDVESVNKGMLSISQEHHVSGLRSSAWGWSHWVYRERTAKGSTGEQ